MEHLPSALTEQNKAELTRCAEDILLAREHYFPATIADMYDPDTLKESLRERMDTEFPLIPRPLLRTSSGLLPNLEKGGPEVQSPSPRAGEGFRVRTQWQRSS